MNSYPTYISLFSGAGIGCYGFKLEKFECIATNEINNRRLNIQKFNKKCRYQSGYIAGNLVEEETKTKIRREYEFWRTKRNVEDLDLIIATPPCQGMSVANHKKKNELGRNSLVVESIKLVREFNPKIFLFENVRSFLQSICTDCDGVDKRIGESIECNLSGCYNIESRVINFKDYGNPSSRTRSIVLGVRKDLIDTTPLDFMPVMQEQQSVRDVIGDLQPLDIMGELCPSDLYHHFRRYSEHMRTWIEEIKESQSAFDNDDLVRRPHRVVNGEMIPNKRNNNDKYTRSSWDKPGPCIHTRNDILSSQTTIHPTDDRVFSIRELMRLMSVPDSFVWTDIPENDLNRLSAAKKQSFLKREELNIRQSIGEAVPPVIFQQIAKRIKAWLINRTTEEKLKQHIIDKFDLNEPSNLQGFVDRNPKELSYIELSKLVEYCNTSKIKYSAYYTRQDICFTLVAGLPDATKFTSLRILEPSVGTGNFLPLLIEKYRNVPSVEIDVVEIDTNALEILKSLITKLHVPTNIKINYINEDFLLFQPEFSSDNSAKKPYDIIVGNPPFGKVSKNSGLLERYKKKNVVSRSNNIFAFFLETSMRFAKFVALIVPKSFLSTPEFDELRNFVGQYSIRKIIDYGEKAFKGVRIETIGLMLESKLVVNRNRIAIESYITKEHEYKLQDYVCAKYYPHWLPYRNSMFDDAASKLRFGVFDAYRDRQITKKNTKPQGKIRVLKSRNIGKNSVIDIPDYDSYVDEFKTLSIGKFINFAGAVLVPNLTYFPRACFLPKDTIVDGSVAVLIPKSGNRDITVEDLEFFSSQEFTEFYRVARNLGTRSLNIDRNSVYFFGLPKAKNYQLQST